LSSNQPYGGIACRNIRVVSQEEWLAARKALLLKEKEATHLRDKINAERLALALGQGG
jgi:predicted dithiol-disulfide oxidoreductase (DUF899 family)